MSVSLIVFDDCMLARGRIWGHAHQSDAGHLPSRCKLLGFCLLSVLIKRFSLEVKSCCRDVACGYISGSWILGT